MTTSKLPEPTMVVWRARQSLKAIRDSAFQSNEHLIDTLCDMAHERPPQIEAILVGLRKLGITRALLRCPENQED